VLNSFTAYYFHMAKTLAKVLAVSIAAILIASCGGGSAPSEVAVDAVSASDSTTTSSTIAVMVPPSTEPVTVEVPATQAPPVTRPTEPSQTIPPSPTTTICVPDQSRLGQLEDDRITDASNFAIAALKNTFESFVPAYGIEINRVRSANLAEWRRALAALQSCQITTWRFENYPFSENYRTPPTTGGWGLN